MCQLQPQMDVLWCVLRRAWHLRACHSPQNPTTPAGPGLLSPTQTPGAQESCNTPNLIMFKQGADNQTPRGRLEDTFWRQMRQEESSQALQLPTSLPGQLLPQGSVEGCFCFMVPYTKFLALEHSQISRCVHDFVSRSLREDSREFF